MAIEQTWFSRSALRDVLRDEWPYGLVLALALFGIAYTSLFRTPMTVYWIVLAPVIGAVCILTRWHELASRDERVRMAWRQVMHWVAVVVAMHIMFATELTRVTHAGDTALAALLMLALGTVTAGIHLGMWRICLIGGLMAAGVPGMAWLGPTALLWLLATLVLIAIAVPVVRHLRKGQKPQAAPPPVAAPTPSS